MADLSLVFAIACATAALGCESAPPVSEQPRAPKAATTVAAVASESAFVAVPDSVWVSVDGPTLIAFHPVVSNDSLDADEGLATSLGDLSYHIGAAMDSLIAAGFKVEYRGGDTVWFRTPARRHRLVRSADSASVGYVFTDTAGRLALVYGLRTSIDLIAFAHEFRLTGALRPR